MEILVVLLVGIPFAIGLAVRRWWWTLGCPAAVLILGILLAWTQPADGEFISPRAAVQIITVYATLLTGAGAIAGTLVGALIRFYRRQAT